MHVYIYMYSFIFKYIPQHIPITLYHLRQSRGVFVSVPPAIEFVDFPSSTPRDVPQDLRMISLQWLVCPVKNIPI